MNKIILFDINKKLCEEWEKQFKDYPDVEIKHCSFEDLESEYVVTAGNSFGWMTGGIDLAVRDYYGIDVQDSVQQVIISQFQGELPVGESIVIDTLDWSKKYLIYAPTMRFPRQIDKVDVFYVFVKLLQRYDNFACCGLGTATGGISEKDCARQMKLAYDYVHYILNEEENEC